MIRVTQVSGTLTQVSGHHALVHCLKQKLYHTVYGSIMGNTVSDAVAAKLVVHLVAANLVDAHRISASIPWHH